MTDNPLDFSGKVTLVTGGARGVGRGISIRFMERGSQVVICGRNAPEAPIAANGLEAAFIAADVRDAAQVDALMAEIKSRFGRLDVVVNNAGGAPPADPSTVSPRFSESIIKLNLVAPLFVSQAANKIMQEQETGGSIVNIASVTVVRPAPWTAAYGAAKAGLINLTQAHALAWAPKVRVNGVIAGLIRTEQAHLHYGDEEGIKRVAATIPLGRMADPSDIGDACIFLSSSLARFVTGAALAVDGGGELPAFLDAASGEKH